MRKSGSTAMVCALILIGLAAVGGGAPEPVRPAWAIRADLALKTLVADGRWGPIAALASAAVATDKDWPVELSADDLATASAYIDNRLGLVRPYPPSATATPSERGLLLLKMVPTGGYPGVEKAIAHASSALPFEDHTARGEAAFRRLPIASHRVDATPFTHLEMLRTALGRAKLQGMLDDLFRRAETDPRAAGLIAASLGSRRILDRPMGVIEAELRAFDADTARPLADSKTPEDRIKRWTFRLADIQARRIHDLAHRILPNDPGPEGGPRPSRPPVDLKIRIDPVLIKTGLILGPSFDDPKVADDAEKEAARYTKILRDRHQIDDARFVTGLATGILGQVNDPTVREISRVLDTGANVTLQILFASTVSSSLAMPLAILNGVSQLLGLLTGGPSEMQLLRQEIAELHREVRVFRRETQINFEALHADLIAKTDAILDHVDRLERMVDRRLDELDGRTDDLERRTIEIRGIVEANHQQALKRFEDLIHLGYVAQENFFAIRKEELRGATPDSPHVLLDQVDMLGNHFYTFAHDAAKSATLAGGDWRVATAYSANQYPYLRKDDARHIVSFVDSPRGVMAYINDYAALVQAEGLSGGILVNPDAWRLGVIDLFRLADCAPKALARPKTRDELARRLATLYIEGERVRDFRAGLVRDPASASANREVFGRLLDMQAEAIDQFEAVLLGPAYAQKTSEVLENVNIWGPDPLRPLPGTIRVANPSVAKDLEDVANLTPFKLPFLQGLEFSLDAERIRLEAAIPADLAGREAARSKFPDVVEQKALEATLPDAYRLAVQLKQGHVEFRYDDLRWGGVHEVVRFEERVWPSSFPNQPPHIERIPIREWFGKVRLTLVAEYVSGDQDRQRRTIYRRLFLAPAEVKIGGLKNEELKDGNPRHEEINWEALGLKGEGRRLEKRAEHHGFLFFGHDVDHVIFVDEDHNLRASELTKHWPAIKSQMLDPIGVVDLSPEFSRQLQASLTSEVIRQLTNIELRAASGTHGGLGELGNELRCLYGTQMMVYRFLELAIPETLARDVTLQGMLMGKEATLNWNDLYAAMRPAVTASTDGKNRLTIQGLIQPGPDGKPRVPMAVTMRSRLDALRMKLDDVVTQAAQAPEPPVYAELDDLLAQFPSRAKRLGIDLKAAVEAVSAERGVKTRPEWFLYREAGAAARLLDLDPGFKAFANPALIPPEAR